VLEERGEEKGGVRDDRLSPRRVDVGKRQIWSEWKRGERGKKEGGIEWWKSLTEERHLRDKAADYNREVHAAEYDSIDVVGPRAVQV
jgi:hypothetical protein